MKEMWFSKTEPEINAQIISLGKTLTDMVKIGILAIHHKENVTSKRFKQILKHTYVFSITLCQI